MGANTSFVLPAVSIARKQLGLPPIGRLVLYAGRFAADHPVDLLMDAAPFIMDQVKLVHFVLIGDGPTRHRLEAEARARSLDAACIFAGDVPPEQLAQFAFACDIGLLISQSVGSSVRPFSVNEIRDFLASGRPVVAASDSADARCFVQANNIGSASNVTGNRPADVAGLIKAIDALLLDDRVRVQRGENARKLGAAISRTSTGGVMDIVRATIRKAASL